jgi:hypothetical protein
MKNALLFLTSLSLLFALSCKKESAEPPATIDLTTSLAGFGSHPGTPSGYAFYLPYHVELTTPLYGMATILPLFPTTEHCGMGTIWTIFTLQNNNNFISYVTFPAGLTFVADNDSSQNAILLKSVTLSLPANSSQSFSMAFFCTNFHKAANYTNFYTMHAVSNNDQVSKLINAVKVKSDLILHQRYYNLQYILWDITDGAGITKADLDTIKTW